MRCDSTPACFKLFIRQPHNSSRAPRQVVIRTQCTENNGPNGFLVPAISLFPPFERHPALRNVYKIERQADRRRPHPQTHAQFGPVAQPRHGENVVRVASNRGIEQAKPRHFINTTHGHLAQTRILTRSQSKIRKNINDHLAVPPYPSFEYFWALDRRLSFRSPRRTDRPAPIDAKRIPITRRILNRHVHQKKITHIPQQALQDRFIPVIVWPSGLVMLRFHDNFTRSSPRRRPRVSELSALEPTKVPFSTAQQTSLDRQRRRASTRSGSPS